MGISIYYDAKRGYPLTENENSQIKTIVEKYNKEKKFKKGENFCIYDYDPEELETMFRGSTGLPMSIINPMLTVKGCVYWTKCLTETRNIVKDAEWDASMDDTELEWDEKDGWKLPTQ